MTIADKLTQIAENTPKIYEAGKEEGIEQGKQAEYDAFWDAFQENGNRASYAYGFYSWRTNIFRPKYDIKPTNANYMFMGMRGEAIDLTERLRECGVVLDTSLGTSFDYAFYSHALTRIPKIDTRNANELRYTFSSTDSIITIDEIMLRDDGSQTFKDVFSWSGNITNLTISGTIGQSGLNLQWSTKLSRASIESIINALSTNTNGLSVTFSQEAVNNAFSVDEWAALETTKSNWTINLV